MHAGKYSLGASERARVRDAYICSLAPYVLFIDFLYSLRHTTPIRTRVGDSTTTAAAAA